MIEHDSCYRFFKNDTNLLEIARSEMDSLHSELLPEANLQGTWICQLTSSRAVTDDQQMYLK